MKIELTPKKTIYQYCAPYVIAEIGANHNGDMELARNLVDAAKDCGADAVKFQSWTPASLISRDEYNSNQAYDDSPKKHFGSLREMVEKYWLRPEQHRELKNYCDDVGIDFCSTPFSEQEIGLLSDLNVPYFKIASMDVNNPRLLRNVAAQGKPVILSTGMATLAEIENAVRWIEAEGNRQLMLLHCISIYPPAFEDIHLRNIGMLHKTFGYPVGFSDHTIGISIPLAATALGSCLIEKHFTINKDLPGWDHEISADPVELKQIVEESKKISKALGSFRRIVSAAEEEKKLKFRRSIVAARSISAGETINKDDLVSKRPGSGIAPDEIDYVVGRKLTRDVASDEMIHWDDLL